MKFDKTIHGYNCFDYTPGIRTSSTPYSRAQRRRFNRKKHEQLGSGLGSIGAVISALEEEEISPPAEAESNFDSTSQKRPQGNSRTGIIGKGKSVPLTKVQRKHVLCVLNSGYHPARTQSVQRDGKASAPAYPDEPPICYQSFPDHPHACSKHVGKTTRCAPRSGVGVSNRILIMRLYSG